MSFEIISIIGLGYIGLPTAAMFASRKKNVVGVDIDPYVVEIINRGEIHIVEPGLDKLVSTAVREGYLKATLTPQPADAFLITVPTPFRSSSSEIPEPDLTYIESAARAIAPVLEKGNLVVLESTSPVGATERLAEWLAEERSDLTFPQANGDDADISVAHCPERVMPGDVIRELVQNDRVIGGMSPTCSVKAAELYKTFALGDCTMTSARTAEMSKLTENACRDVQIAFANELSVICDKLDIDVWELISLANLHPRVNILKPGAGVGGHCIAVDPWFIVSRCPSESQLIQAARRVNNSKPAWVVNKVKAMISDHLRDNPHKKINEIVIACYGVAFKPDIDDLRESPALAITKNLLNVHGGRVIVIEPNIEVLPRGLEEATLESYDTAKDVADIHVLLVAHRHFEVSPPKSHYIIDTQGVWKRYGTDY